MAILHFDARLRYPDGFQLDASFEGDAGVTALFGPSGSGKTTILSLIAGTVKPDSAIIRLGERTLVDTQAKIFLRPEKRNIGVVFQDHLLFPHLSVRKNLLFGHDPSKPRTIDFKRVLEILEIGDLVERYPGSLSGGQRQRIALGRALLRSPDLLLMDEPLASLDVGLKDRILTYLERAVAEWHIPTLFVSHDKADVSRLASKVVVIEGGRVIAARREHDCSQEGI